MRGGSELRSGEELNYIPPYCCKTVQIWNIFYMALCLLPLNLGVCTFTLCQWTIGAFFRVRKLLIQTTC